MSYIRPNYSPLTPCVIVSDDEKSIAFYTQVFGFELLEKHERDSIIRGATLKLGEVNFMPFSQFLSFYAKNATPEQAATESILYVYCSNVDTLYKKALEYGAISVTEPEDAFGVDRYCQLRDLDGYEWVFATYKQAA